MADNHNKGFIPIHNGMESFEQRLKRCFGMTPRGGNDFPTTSSGRIHFRLKKLPMHFGKSLGAVMGKKMKGKEFKVPIGS
jgi:hypothetical protein